MVNYTRKSTRYWFVVLVVILLGLSLACSTVTSLLSGESQTSSEDQEVAKPYSEEEGQPQFSMAPPPEEQFPGEGESLLGEPLRQWAARASASSEYGAESWSAKQATGEPNTPNCEDQVTAWASETSSGVDTLEVFFDVPVHAFEVNIIQSYNPDQVVKVELIKSEGGLVNVYTHAPQAVDVCPFKLTVKFEPTPFLVNGVRLTIDQSVLGLGWNEIDAVQLVGFPE